MAERRIYSVTELNRLIRQTLENQLGRVFVEGEISNLSRPASGHLYFTIKDADAQISAVMFRGNQTTLKFEPKAGTQIQASGDITVYEKGGRYQIIIRKMIEAGKGSLHVQFEKLKKALAEEGLFDEGLKQDLPVLARRVGVVTSATGAAIRDILNVVSRRYPNLHVQIAPVRVQGEGAAEEIAAAIDLLNERAEMDVLIVGRGGGSIEDLWSFNEECVARAIYRSTIPVISAVGHETDFTISDFVADMRAPTPSAAAELVVGRKDEFEEHLNGMERRLAIAIQTSVKALRNRVLLAARSYVFREPGNMVMQARQRVDRLYMQMSHSLDERRRHVRQRLQELTLRIEPVTRQQLVRVRQLLADAQSEMAHASIRQVGEHRVSLERLGDRMAHAMAMRRERSRRDLERLQSQLKALSPAAVLERGYSVTRKADGTIVRSSDEVAMGDRLYTRVASGTVESEVKGTDHGKKES